MILFQDEKSHEASTAGSALKHVKDFKTLKIPTSKALVVQPLELMKEEVLLGQICEEDPKRKGIFSF